MSKLSTAVRRTVTATLVAATVAGGAVVTAPAADAATGVSSCFRWNSNNGTAYAGQPVYLMQYNGSQWVAIRKGKTGANGCSTFGNTPANAYLTVQAYVVLNSGSYHTAWSGFASHYTGPGSGTASVGRGTVTPAYTY